jgi:hypothetical protein
MRGFTLNLVLLGSVTLRPAMLLEIFVEHSAVTKNFYKLLGHPEISVPARWNFI